MIHRLRFRIVGALWRFLLCAEVRIIEETPESVPVRMDPGDAGFDLIVSQYTIIRGGETVDVSHGCRIKIPDWCWGMIRPRSSTWAKRGLIVRPGVIDSGYTGPLYIGVHNPGDEEVILVSGERVAQLILIPRLCDVTFTRVWELPKTDRGDKGFGSTGGFRK